MTRRSGSWIVRLTLSLALIITLFGSIGMATAQETTPDPATEEDVVEGHDHSTHDHSNRGENQV